MGLRTIVAVFALACFTGSMVAAGSRPTGTGDSSSFQTVATSPVGGRHGGIVRNTRWLLLRDWD